MSCWSSRSAEWHSEDGGGTSCVTRCGRGRWPSRWGVRATLTRPWVGRCLGAVGRPPGLLERHTTPCQWLLRVCACRGRILGRPPFFVRLVGGVAPHVGQAVQTERQRACWCSARQLCRALRPCRQLSALRVSAASLRHRRRYNSCRLGAVVYRFRLRRDRSSWCTPHRLRCRRHRRQRRAPLQQQQWQLHSADVVSPGATSHERAAGHERPAAGGLRLLWQRQWGCGP